MSNYNVGDKVRMGNTMGRGVYEHPACVGKVTGIGKGEFTGCYTVTTEDGRRYPVYGSDLAKHSDNEVAEGELQGWAIDLKVVTNGMGKVAVVTGGNESVVLVGPTSYMPKIANWISEYLQEDV